MSFNRLTTQVHKWAGIVLGIQILLWTVGGFVMAVSPIEKVRGEHKSVAAASIPLDAASDYIAPSAILTTEPANTVHDMTLIRLHGYTVYKVTYQNGRQAIFNARTGEKLSPLSEERIDQLAGALYAAGEPVRTLHYLEQPITEFRSVLPVWQVTFADADNTRFYLDPDTGEHITTRTDLWRFYDFFWMLHIMDFENRSDFNNPVLIVFAGLSTIFILTGFVLIYYRLKPKKRRKGSERRHAEERRHDEAHGF